MTWVLLHGLGQAPSAWDGVCSHLPQSMDIVRPDLTALLHPGTYDDLYQAFCLDCARRQAPFSLCGLSLGAVLALHYALEHPQNVKALCLIAPQYRMPRRLLAIQDVLFRLLPASAFADTGMDRTQMRSLTRSMMTLDFTARLRPLGMPVHIVCGQKDRANRKAARELADRLAPAQLHWIAGAGHEVNRDAPARLAAILVKMMREDHGANPQR